MIKKITAILLSFVMFVMPVSASVYDEWLYGETASTTTEDTAAEINQAYEKYIDVLYGLGITRNVSSTLSRGTKVNRGDFLELVMKIDIPALEEGAEDIKFSDVTAADSCAAAVSAAAQQKIIDGEKNGNFNPYQPVTYAAAQKILVNVLGYREVAEKRGGFPAGYDLLSRRLGFEIKPINSDALTGEEVAAMVVAALDAPATDVVAISVSEKDNELFLESAEGGEKSWLYLNYGIKKVKGILDRNEYTALYKPVGGRENTVSVNGTEYKTNDEYWQLIGKSVVAYVSDDTKELIYAYESDANEIIGLTSADIVEVSGRKVRYRKGDRVREIDIPKTAAVIYNNVSRPNYSMSDLKVKNGYLEVITNETDKGKTVTVKIYEYIPIVINSIDLAEGILYAKTVDTSRNVPAIKDISLKCDEYETFRIFTQRGEDLLFEQLVRDSVLNVLFADDKKCVMAYQGGDKTQGKLEEVVKNGQKSIVVNADRIEYSDMAMTDIGSLSLGKQVIVYTDMFGRAVYVRTGILSDAVYAYLLDVKVDGVFASTSKFKIFDAFGEVKILDGSETMFLNGARVADQSVFKTTFTSPVAILYSVDAYGCIKRIFTPDANGSPLKSICGTSDEKLMYTGGGSYKFAKSSGFDDTSFCMDETTVVLSIPPDASSAEDKMFGTMDPTKIPQFARYNVQAYTQNEDSNAAEFVLVLSKRNNIQKSNDAAVVTGIAEGLNSNGDVVKLLTLSSYTFKEKTYKTTDLSVTEDIIFTVNDAAGAKDVTTDVEVGDIIIYTTNIEDEIFEIGIVSKGVDVANTVSYWSSAAFNGVWYDNLSLYCGKIKSIKNDIVEFELCDNPANKITFKLAQQLLVVEINKNSPYENGVIRYIEKDAIPVGEASGVVKNVMLYVKTGTPRIMVIYK